MVEHNPYASPVSAFAEDDLGELMFERRASLNQILALVIAAGLTSIIPGLVVAGVVAGEIDFEALPMIVQLGVISIVLWCVAIHSIFRITSFHQNGICASGLMGRRYLSYENIERFVFLAARPGHNRKTRYTLTFFSPKGVVPRKIIFNYVAPHEDVSILGLRDRVSDFIANRLEREWKRTGNVTWTEDLRFTETAVESISKRTRVLFSQIDSYWVQNFTLTIRAKDNFRSTIEEPMTASNLFPGLILLERLRLAASAPDSAPEPDSAPWPEPE